MALSISTTPLWQVRDAAEAKGFGQLKMGVVYIYESKNRSQRGWACSALERKSSLKLSKGNTRLVGKEELMKPDQCGGRETEIPSSGLSQRRLSETKISNMDR